MAYREVGGLRIAEVLYDFVIYEALSGTGIGAQQFWSGVARLIEDFAPRIRDHLNTRARLQNEIDAYHLAHRGQAFDAADYDAHLRAIGYLVDAPADCTIRTTHIEEAVLKRAAPQILVPASNARYLLSAANARWGNLYAALYGTDAISEEGGATRGPTYNELRGARVIARARAFLDEVVPLAKGSHASAIAYSVDGTALCVTLEGGEKVGLKDSAQFIGFQGRPTQPSCVLLLSHGLHIEIKIDRDHAMGRGDAAGIAGIILESALTIIVDFEDSTVAVDAQDKVGLYRNWLELMKGTLRAQFKKNGRITDRLLALDRRYNAASGEPLTLPGRGLMLVRTVGPHMFSDAILDAKGEAIPEAILDAAMSALIGIHDLKRAKAPRNSLTGAIYIVMPKLHGPQEVALADELFARVETMLRLPKHSLKMGLIDEERRTSLNLKACMQAAADRIVFVNQDSLDRTGSEIHEVMEAGPLVCTSEMTSPAWVASPTAATLQALHYHEGGGPPHDQALHDENARLSDHLAIPMSAADFRPEEIARNLDHHCQRILGYVARWIDQGIGCSKVPDIHDISHMEDRAILRLSSQHIANWLHHGIVSEAQVKESLERMALLVDRQNASDPDYRAMAPQFDGQAFATAADLIFKGRLQPNGYTEEILTPRRRAVKAGHAPNVSNKYEALKGAMKGLESGEALLGTAD
jgi:malate synthase